MNLAAYLSLFALTGHQALEVHFNCQDVGLKEPIGTYFTPDLLLSPAKAKNLGTLGAENDWDLAPVLGQCTNTLMELRSMAHQYCFVPTSPHQLQFLEYYAGLWQQNWQATAVEDEVLKRLDLAGSTQATMFAEKLSANPQNLRYTYWHHWFGLMYERRKSEAAEYLQEKGITPKVEFSQTYRLVKPLQFEILWPSKSHWLSYTYTPTQHKWFPHPVHSVNAPHYYIRSWEPPNSKQFVYSWQPGPSWQTTYSSLNGELTQTFTYVDGNSYIQGEFDDNGNLSERIIPYTQPCYINANRSSLYYVSE